MSAWLNGIPVYRDELAPHTDRRGERILCVWLKFLGRILVHPTRWEEFWMIINAPDVHAHPEVQAIFGEDFRVQRVHIECSTGFALERGGSSGGSRSEEKPKEDS